MEARLHQAGPAEPVGVESWLGPAGPAEPRAPRQSVKVIFVKKFFVKKFRLWRAGLAKLARLSQAFARWEMGGPGWARLAWRGRWL